MSRRAKEWQILPGCPFCPSLFQIQLQRRGSVFVLRGGESAGVPSQNPGHQLELQRWLKVHSGLWIGDKPFPEKEVPRATPERGNLLQTTLGRAGARERKE